MLKFSILNENHNLGRFIISRQQMGYYKSEINKILQDLYKDSLINEPGFGTFVKPQKFEPTPNRHISILNKVNTNIKFLSLLVEKFKLNSIGEVVSFVSDNKKDLFLEGGEYLPILIKTIRSTELEGEKNEELASRYLKSVIFEKTNKSIDPKISPISSRKDLIDGIDIEFKIDNSRPYTCQVKPYKGMSVIGDKIIVTTSGLVKHYSVDYICFSNSYSGKSCLFRNRGFEIVDYNKISFPSSSLVD